MTGLHAAPSRSHANLLGRFAEQVRHQPDALAVIDPAGNLTYGQLAQSSDRIARNLQAQGVTRGQAIALALPRSWQWVAAILGALKAGATVVPLDTASPPERRERMLADAACIGLLGLDEVPTEPLPPGVWYLGMDALLDAPADPPVPVPEGFAEVMFLFYTSGSTGTPKAVEVGERGLLRLAAPAGYIQINPGDRFACVSNPAFDACSFELWAPLLNGGACVIITEQALLDAHCLADTLNAHGVHTLFVTVALFNTLTAEWPGCFAGQRQVLIGGEQVSAAAVKAWYAANPHSTCQLFNAYGPTECTTFALCYPIPRAFNGSTVPIGWPLPETGLQVLDTHGQPVAPGEAGELYLSGSGLARGYRLRPAETAQAFVERATPGGDAERLYRTGDQVRIGDDGAVHYVGRLDRQVKVRGFRIEPGEIEQCLEACPGVAQAYVCTQRQAAEDHHVLAFVVPNEEALTYASFTAHVRAHLAPYMRPHRVYTLASLPLTANGKVDRTALLAQAVTPWHEHTAGPGVAAVSLDLTFPLGWLLDQAQQRLSQPALGPEDDWLGSGGDSLSALRLRSAIRDRWERDLPITALLSEPFTALAARLAPQADIRETGYPPPPVAQGATLAPASAEQRRLWLIQQRYPDSTAYHVPLALRLCANLDLIALEQALNLLVQTQPALRTYFAQGEEGLDQVVAEQGAVCQRLAAGRFTESNWPAFARLVFGTPFDLAQPTLFQAYLLPVADGRPVLLLHVHHILVDGWSLNLLFEALAGVYQQVLAGRPHLSPRPAPSLSTLEFAQWQQRWQATETYQTQRQALAQWQRRQPAPSPALIPLHGDGPTAVLLRQPLGASRSAALEGFCARHRMTRYEVLLAVFSWSLYAVAGTRRPRVASPVANRPLAAFEPVVGMLANTVLVPHDLDPELALSEQLRRGVATSRQVMALQDVMLGDLVEDLAGDTRAGASEPLFDFMFVMENTDYAVLDAGSSSLGATLAFPAALHAKCPLTLTVVGQGTHLESWWEYQCSYFDAAQVQALDAQLHHGLDQLLHAPHSRLGDLIGPYRQGLPAASEGKAQAAPFSHVADWFAYQAQATPHALAIVSRTEQVTYARLDQLADTLAARLLRQCPLPSDAAAPAPVVVLLEASLEHVVTLLALARLNLTAVPLDPAYPVAAQRQVLAQAQACCVLYSAATEAALAALGPVPCPSLSVDLSAPAEAFQRSGEGATRPLYTLFTSGSTGTPKGVQVAHYTLCNLLHWQQGEGGLGAAAATLQFSMLSFDVSFQEVFSTLCGGGCYHLITPRWRQDAEALLTYLVEARIERLFLPCVALQHLAQTAVRRGLYPTALREVITAGEQLLCNEPLRTWFSGLPHARLFNHYGPTETHVISAWRLTGPARDWPLRAPIGQAVANARLILVDAKDRPVPPGRRGQLLVSGPMVSACYLNAPDLNASRFIRREGRDGVDSLYYRTGDLAWADAHGCLHYVGRDDQQIKLSGHRLELGQVEAALMHAPGVVNAVVALYGEPARLTAYLQVENDATTAQALDLHVARHLPAQVRIDQYRRLAHWPRTPSGKVDRKALAGLGEVMAHDPAQGRVASPPTNATALEQQLIALFQDVVGRDIGLHETFFEAGATSLGLMRLQARCNQVLLTPVAMADLFEHVTIRRLAAHLNATQAPSLAEQPAAAQAVPGAQPLAIIGMAVNVAGAPNLAAFWDMVRSGTLGIEHFTAPEGYVGARSQLDGMLAFDPEYFGISRQEARLMDPQQRHLLMACVQALEHAGMVPGDAQRIGLIASGGEATYFQQMLKQAGPGDLPDGFQMALHHDKDYLATKAAYHLGLTGPAMSVQAACGGSLIATHLASALLRQGDADVMLAAGVLIDPTLVDGYRYRPQHIFSKDGLCRPFSEDASGTIGASGYGVVVLKPLAQAQADGDRVYGVLEATALNNDGHGKMSYTAPSVAGQRGVIREALHRAGVSGADIGYVEAHGTGTLLGDPVEVAALRSAFGAAPVGHCALASVKSQIGHLGAAAGVVGLIRATLAVYHGLIPPNLGFSRLNPQVDMDGSPFYVPTEARAWAGTQRRLAGVSSFGIGGTNAHAIVGQPPEATPMAASLDVVPCLVVSAHSRTALLRDLDALEAYVRAHPECQGALMQYLHKGRPAQRWRVAAEHIPGHPWPQFTDVREVMPTGTRVNSTDFTPAELVAAWYAGASIEWPGHAAPPPWDLPPSSFDLEDYRFKASAASEPGEPVSTDGAPSRLPLSAWFYQRQWQRVCRLAPQAPEGRRPLLVVCAAEPLAPSLRVELQAVYQRVVQACPGATFEAVDADDYRFDPANPQAVTDLLDALALTPGTPLDWLHALPMCVTGAVGETSLAAAQWACLDTPSALLQSWGQQARQAHLRLWFMSWQACPVDGQVARPELAALAGPNEVIPQEYAVRCHWVDWPTEHLADHGPALATLLSAPESRPRRMAVRNGYLWQPRLVPSPLPAGAPSAHALPQAGTFLVLGGSGGIGMSLCQYLLREPGRRVILLSREGQVPAALVCHGSRVEALKADLGDLARWPQVLDTLGQREETLAAVIHAAGVGAGSLIRLRDPVHMRNAMAAKTHGVLAVEALIARFAPQAVVYCSSMSALLGGVGHLDYAATNALLDGFAHYQAPEDAGSHRLCIDWDIWREVGMAVGASTSDAAHQQHLTVGLSVEEGCEVFERAMAAGLPQVLVSTTALEVARRFYPSRPVSMAAPAQVEQGLPGAASDAEPSQPSQGDAVALRLHGCLCQWLGVDDLAEDANLYELGADSLTLLDLIDELQSATGETFQLSQFSPQVSLGEVLALVSAAHGQVAPTVQEGWDHAVLLDPWQAGDGRQWLYLVHPVGGDVQAYRELVANLDPALGVCVIADPALRLPELPAISLEERARVYLAAIQARHPQGATWQVAGWSFGAWVAQALCAQAAEAGFTPSGLYLIDPPAPDAGKELATIDEHSIEQVFQREFALRWPGTGESTLPADLQAYLARLTQCCRNNIASMAGFVPPRLATTPVQVFMASQPNPYGIGTAWAPEALKAAWQALLPRLEGWQPMATDHYGIVAGPWVQRIAQAISRQHLVDTPVQERPFSGNSIFHSHR
ncbi:MULTISPECIES: hybrid non-ribosomal peptide synthetase/type I polyketide synthase [Pseudomonas]|uniref:Amino acid adenylation domain-containing protein n=1 Tax=Pseudomonas quercus TaxID=2722792 RepID=A0ABX0Y957_9PSED|nr:MULTISPECIES: non-ribosomal peptide synthetase [Pseudomonas]MBF7140965.1 amino acid adenylation domain-containing protein [Pseudomonas sp. LY10J]NJO99499.1 amino acid adenylation domain-containing protein [Pseudomonas quercus]